MTPEAFNVAADLLNQGSYLEALGAYQEIVTYSESYENRAKGLLFMGAIYSLYLDQYDEALRLYSILMRDYSKSSFAQDALFNIGKVFYEKGNFEQAYMLTAEASLKLPRVSGWLTCLTSPQHPTLIVTIFQEGHGIYPFPIRS